MQLVRLRLLSLSLCLSVCAGLGGQQTALVRRQFARKQLQLGRPYLWAPSFAGQSLTFGRPFGGRPTFLAVGRASERAGDERSFAWLAFLARAHSAARRHPKRRFGLTFGRRKGRPSLDCRREGWWAGRDLDSG